MARYVAPNADSMSEFGRYNGDCGGDMIYMLLHCYDPARFPLNLDALNAFVADLIAHGEAEANGAMALPAVDHCLTRLGIAHTMINGDYAVGAGASDGAIHSALQAMFVDGAAGQPLALVGVETSLAHVGAAGAQDDEAGVRNHYWGFVGCDDTAQCPDTAGNMVKGGYLRVDGDSRTDSAQGAPTPPILTSMQVIASAQCWGGVIIPPFAPATRSTADMWTIEQDAQGIHGAHDENGAHVGAGMALYFEQNGLLGTHSLIPAGEVYQGSTGVVTLSNGDVRTWHDNAVHDNEAAQVAAFWYAQLQESEAATKAAQAAQAAAEAQAAQATQAAQAAAAQTAQEEAQEAATPAAPAPAPVAPAVPRVHVVSRNGDGTVENAEQIAAAWTHEDGTPVTVAQILDANRDRVSNLDALTSGMSLAIPA